MHFPRDLFDYDETDHSGLFREEEPAWTALGRIDDYLTRLLDEAEATGSLLCGEIHERAVLGDRVYVGPGSTVEANAVIQGPAWIGEGTIVRSGAYLRQNVIAGNECVLGNSSEFKNCLLFNRCEVPHFNYVGDSILGHRAHLGAGVICSNFRLDRRNVVVRDGQGGFLDTGLRKFGALVGDRTEVGCHTVLSPGSILGRDCILYPTMHWQGVLGEKQIAKHRGGCEVVARHFPGGE